MLTPVLTLVLMPVLTLHNDVVSAGRFSDVFDLDPDVSGPFTNGQHVLLNQFSADIIVATLLARVVEIDRPRRRLNNRSDTEKAGDPGHPAWHKLSCPDEA